jgi:hypothetical protein
MKQHHALKLIATDTPSEMPLSCEQLEALRRCAKGISLRFDAHEIVNALVTGGYVMKGVAGVITVTTEGHELLRKHAS